MKLVLTGSSYLMPKSNDWLNLNSKNYEVCFSGYANWANELIKSNTKNIIVLILFLEDLFRLETKEEEMKKNLKTVLKLILQRLKLSNAPILLAPLYIESINLINESKSSSNIKKIYFWLISELEELKKGYNNFYFIDVESEFSNIGKKSCLDKRNWYVAHCHLSNLGIRTIAKSICKCCEFTIPVHFL